METIIAIFVAKTIIVTVIFGIAYSIKVPLELSARIINPLIRR